MYKKIALSLTFILYLGMLTACSPDKILRLKNNESNTQKTSSSAKNDTKISTPVALPPSYKDQPLKPGQSKTVYLPNGLPALQPMKGINIETLFSENIKDTGDRFNRVENAVVDLRKEFEVYRPAIVRLTAVESDIQNLIKELEVLLQETPTPQEPQSLITRTDEAELQVSQLNLQPKHPTYNDQDDPKVVPKKVTPQVRTANKEPPPQKATPPPRKEKTKPEKPIKQYDRIVANNLRVGEHADKLRIVLDTNKHTNFSIDLDNEEQLVIIELPDAKWVGNKAMTFKDSKLIESYSIEPINGGNGSMIIISLRKPTMIMQKKRLPPDTNNPYNRIYFDLKP